ncbi:uncharacterized protein J8A68_001072 [[Candida] subhashii]|uniref:Alpha-1,2-Mannosidase n=1 Tax=[Candida] subhashii TaxID=561895 RepID=A0A8J5QGK8_9ASCO|nr:uncharacterized protein J8A68_001072 [[Candida] subhashii]KAG7665384.1 hypothetical protein J8A68_001072 [[Candida] subhashii]
MSLRYEWEKLLIVVLSVIVLCDSTTAYSPFNSSFTPDHIRYLQQETKELYDHAWSSYMTYGFPADEVTPITCQPLGPDYTNALNTHRNDAMANVSLTVLDNLDTLIIMQDWDSLEFILEYMKSNQQGWFEQDTIVQVFEMTIRSLGGLLSAHLLLTDINLTLLPSPAYDRFKEICQSYDGFLLHMAHDLGLRLIPSYKTTTNIPMPRINLAKGLSKIPSHLQIGACTAGATTPILEFTLLSRLTGDYQFEYYTQLTFWKLWSSKSVLHLLPMSINTIKNEWADAITGVGASIDSFYEYAAKGAILFNDDYMWEVFKVSYRALLTHSAEGGGEFDGTMIFSNVNTEEGASFGDWIDSLGAFWPGLQVLTGQVKDAIKTHAVYLKIWDYFDSIPERWVFRYYNPRKKFNKSEDAIELQWYALRPEFIESTYYLYRATRDPMYLQIGERVLNLFRDRYMTECGFSGLQDVTTGSRQDRMETFVIGESIKYLYLLFDTKDELFLHDPKIMNNKNWIFSTEAHPLWLNKDLDLLGIFKNSSILNDDNLMQKNLYEKFIINNSTISQTSKDLINAPVSTFLRNLTLVKRGNSPIPGVPTYIHKRDPLETRFDHCELNPWHTYPDSFLESNYYKWDHLFSADYLYNKSLIKPKYLSKSNLDGSYIELTKPFYDKFTMFNHKHKQLYLQCPRPATTRQYDVFWLDIKECNQIEVSEIYFDKTPVDDDDDVLMISGDLWAPEFRSLKISFEELMPGQIDTRNRLISQEYIDSVENPTNKDNGVCDTATKGLLRILRINGVYVKAGVMIWTKPFEVSEQSFISIQEDSRVVINGQVVENLMVWPGV